MKAPTITPADRALAASIAAAHPLESALRLFRVTFKRGSTVQDSFEVYGTDSVSVTDAHMALKAPGQIMVVSPVYSEAELLAGERRRCAAQHQGEKHDDQ